MDMTSFKFDEKTDPRNRRLSQRLRIQSLIQDLRSKDGMVRLEARNSLAFIGKRAAPCLIPLLHDGNEEVRWEAAKTLSQIGDAGSASELVAALEDRNFGVRWLAAKGLIAIGREALIPLWEALTKRPDSVFLRRGAHHVSYELAQRGLKELVAPVLAAVEGAEPEVEVLEAAYRALDKMDRFQQRGESNLPGLRLATNPNFS
jgi:HEAT repeat protein